MSERPDTLDVLNQDSRWWPASGPSIRVEDMGPRHRRNTLEMIRRGAEHYRMKIAAAVLDSDLADTVHFDMIASLVSEGPALTWIEAQPLVVRLAELVAADQAAGTPDEAITCPRRCLMCADDLARDPATWPCLECPECNLRVGDALAAAEDATWD